MIKKLFYILLVNSLLLSHAIAVQIPQVIQQQELLAGFNQPSAVAIDKNNNIFVLDGLNQRIVVFNSDAKQLYQISLTFMDNDSLAEPVDMLLNGEKILLADTGNHRLVELDLQGHFIQSIALKQLLKADQKIPEPVGLWLEHGVLYWSDRANHQICQMQLSQQKLIRCFGAYGEGKDQFRFPFQMATDRDGYLHSVDVLNGRVLVFNSRGNFFSQIGRFGLSPGELFRPNGIAVDKADFVFVSDSYLGTIAVFKSGRFVTNLMDSNNNPVHFETPVHLRLQQNKLLVVDALKNSVTQLTLSYQLQDKPVGPPRKTSRQLPGSQKISSRKNCINCHVSWEDKRITQLLRINDKKVLPVASEKMCYSCHHGAVVESRVAMRKKHQHPTVYSENTKEKKDDPEHNQDKIPDLFPRAGKDELLCSSCHSPHNSDEDQEVLYTDHKNSWMRISNQNGNLCEHCHESKGIGARGEEKEGTNHPLAIRFSPVPTKNAKNHARETSLQHGIPEILMENGGVLDQQHQLICQTCHQIHAGKEKDLLTLSNTSSELCISCHKSKYAQGKEKSHQKGIHPINVKLKEAIEYQGKTIRQVTCSSCHKVHKGKVNTALLRDITEQNIETLCTICHQRHTAESSEEAVRKGIHPVNIKLKEAVKINNKTIKTITCLTCHSVHQGKKQTASLVQSDNNGQLCKNCHKEEQQVFNTDHDLRLTASDKRNHHDQLPEKAGLCGSCHSMHIGHGEKDQLSFLYAAKTVAENSKQQQAMDKVLLHRDQLCINCHQDNGIAKEKVVNHFSHPYQDIILRSDPEQMPLLKISGPNNNKSGLATKKNHEFGMIACVTCHNPHIWEPETIRENTKSEVKEKDNEQNREGSSKNSFLRQADIKGRFCVSCHGIEARIKYKYYHDKSNARGIGADYLK